MIVKVTAKVAFEPPPTGFRYPVPSTIHEMLITEHKTAQAAAKAALTQARAFYERQGFKLKEIWLTDFLVRPTIS